MPEPECLLDVRVTPRASRHAWVWGDPVRCLTTKPPVDGEANEAVVASLAKLLGIAKSRVDVVAGHKSRDKRLRIAGLSADDVRQALGG